MIYNKHTTHIIILQEREALYYYLLLYLRLGIIYMSYDVT